MKRPYKEIMKDVEMISSAKEVRKLHKELKRDNKSGLPLFMRYPDMPIYISVLALIIAIGGMVLLWKL
jgi:hypothetical protein